MDVAITVDSLKALLQGAGLTLTDSQLVEAVAKLTRPALQLASLSDLATIAPVDDVWKAAVEGLSPVTHVRLRTSLLPVPATAAPSVADILAQLARGRGANLKSLPGVGTEAPRGVTFFP